PDPPCRARHRLAARSHPVAAFRAAEHCARQQSGSRLPIHPLFLKHVAASSRQACSTKQSLETSAAPTLAVVPLQTRSDRTALSYPDPRPRRLRKACILRAALLRSCRSLPECAAECRPPSAHIPLPPASPHKLKRDAAAAPSRENSRQPYSSVPRARETPL